MPRGRIGESRFAVPRLAVRQVGGGGVQRLRSYTAKQHRARCGQAECGRESQENDERPLSPVVRPPGSDRRIDDANLRSVARGGNEALRVPRLESDKEVGRHLDPTLEPFPLGNLG